MAHITRSRHASALLKDKLNEKVAITKPKASEKLTVLGMKSPVLRDRTNMNNDHIEDNTSSKKKGLKSNENKVLTQGKELLNKLKESSKLSDGLALQEINLSNSEINKRSTTRKLIQQKRNEVPANSANVKAVRKKNISIDDLEKILNNDDDDADEFANLSEEEEENNADENSDPQSENENLDLQNGENKKVNKKFFKTKDGQKTTKPVIKLRVNNQKKTKAVRRKKKSDVSFEVDNVSDCSNPVKKNLRTKTSINYCELSKLSQNSKSTPKESKKQEPLLSNVEKNQKGLPIYKTVRLSQEKVENKEAVYEFFYDSPEKKVKGKKKKQTRRPAIKKVKKTKNVETKKPLNLKKTVVKKNIEDVKESNKEVFHDIPNNFAENIVNLGDSTIQEAPTLKIVSDEKLKGCNKINLASTPRKSNVIARDPKNSFVSEPATSYDSMIDHSLVRKSLSPINKLSENFDTGSPWRPVDTFCRVRKMVQSTPQIHRQNLPSKILQVPENCAKKSFHSQSTIHKSTNYSLSIPEQNSSCISPIKECTSPRKFGTELSNTSSGKSSSNGSSRNSIQNGQPSTSKASFEELKDQEDIPMIAAFANKENISPRANRSPIKKVSPPCPFRFEKIRSSKRLATKESNCNEPKITENTSKQESKSSEKTKIPVMKQSNLDAFLNIDEMPASSTIVTAHGIFDDLCPSTVRGIEPKKSLVEEPNIENAFGFESDIDEELLTIRKEPVTTIATKKDVAKSVKGKIFPKARVKSALPSRISENTVKQTLLKDIVTKKTTKEIKVVDPIDEKDSDDESSESTQSKVDIEDYTDPNLKKKKVLDSISFLDTFDVLSETQELESKVPEQVPLFVDLEPAHFTQPPRRSYNKRKRAVQFKNQNHDSEDKYYDSDDSDENARKKRSKTKKGGKVNKEEQKKMKDWIKSINSTFDEIDQFDLLVE